MDVCAPDPSGAVLCNRFKWEILLFIISDPKSYCLCACYNSVIYFIPQPWGDESSRRQTQCSSTLNGCLCTWTSWYCCLQSFHMRYFVVHFWSKVMFFLCACHKSKIKFIPQPQEQKSCRRQKQYSSTVCGYFCTWTIWGCLIEPLSNKIFCGSFLIKNLVIYLCA